MAWIKTKITSEGQRRYKVQYHGPDGRTHSRTFRRSEDARQFSRDVETAKRQGEYLNPSRARTTVRDYWPRFMESSPDLRPTTRDLYEGLARNHLLPLLGDYRLSAITLADVNTFIARLGTDGVRPPTINATFRLLRTVLSAAVAERLIVKNPARATKRTREGVRLPEMKREEMRFLEPSEVHRLAAELPDRYQALVLLLGFCGLRIGEALALRVSDLDLLRRQVSISRTLGELSGGRLHFGRPKTDQSRRTVALPAFVSNAISAHLAAFPPGEDGLVFTSPAGGPVRLRNFRARMWGPAIRRAGLEPLRIHDLRHSAASIGIAAGAHPKHIQSMLGHSSIAITMDRYGHRFPDASADLAQRVDAIGRASFEEKGAFSVPSTSVASLPTFSQVNESTG